MRLPSALLLVLLAAGPAPSTRAQAAWPTTDWHVICPDTSSVAVPAMCDDTNPVAAAAFVRQQLDETSRWLRDLGFRAPRVDRVAAGTRFLARIGADTLRSPSSGRAVCGYYQYDPSGGGRLLVDAGHMIHEEGRADETGTGAHELFHGVQAAYPFYPGRTRDHAWIIEGTAQAVEAAYLHRTAGVPLWGDGGHAFAYGHRDYSRPLHQPDLADTDQRYATSHFWLGLGEVLGATDRVAYLDTLLARVSLSGGGLPGVDATLRTFEPEGLRVLFPRVLARVAGDRRHYSLQSADALPAEAYETETVVRVPPYAASYARFTVAPRPGQILGVEVATDDADHAHLIVGDDLLSEPSPLDPDRPRNVFHAQVPARTEFTVRLVHTPDVGAAGPPAALPLRLRVRPLDACEPAPMMAALHPDFVRMQRRIAGVLPGRAAGGMIRDAETYVRRFETPETAPAPGRLTVSGLVSDAGVACGDPLGTSPLFAAAADGDPSEVEDALTDPAAALALAQAMADRIRATGLDAMLDSTFALDEQVSDTPAAGLGVGALLDGAVGPHTALRVFSPNAVGWQLDWLLPEHAVLRHDGTGGWQPNAAAVLPVILPGTAPAALRRGRTVPAQLATIADDPDGVLVYTRWTGRHERAAGADPDEPMAFEGELVTVWARALTGTFEVADVTGAEVFGRVRLAGTARRVTERYRFTRDDSGAVDGDERVGEDEVVGPFAVEALTRTPAAAEVRRPGRFVEGTARLGGR